MSAQVAADLRAAAEVLRRDGWTQGSYSCEDGRRCMEGAIYLAADWQLDRIHASVNTVKEHISPTPIDWNDAPGRTASEVIAALEAAADAAEAQS